MSKLPSHYENPIDCIWIELADKFVPVLSRNDITPNMVTTVGNILRIGSLYSLIKLESAWGFLILALTSYFLDCLDVHLAR